jgi:hypothetical protein
MNAHTANGSVCVTAEGAPHAYFQTMDKALNYIAFMKGDRFSF